MDRLKTLGDLDILRALRGLAMSSDAFAAEHHAEMRRGRDRARLHMALPATGKRPHHSTIEGERLASDEAVRALRHGLLQSLAFALTTTTVALVFAAAIGAVHPSLSWNVGKALQAAGGGFALWGTLFAFKGPPHTWAGSSVAERVHSTLYTGLLCAGGSLALVGTLL